MLSVATDHWGYDKTMTFTCQLIQTIGLGIVHRNNRISKLIVPMMNARKDGLLGQAHFFIGQSLGTDFGLSLGIPLWLQGHGWLS